MQTTIEIQKYPLWQKVNKRQALVQLEFELTARCNNNCKHCYINLPADDKQARKNELSSIEIVDIASQAVEMGALWCLLTGGEPLLRPDFKDIYLALKKMGLLIAVYTNATLISSEIIELFKKYPPRDIEITVYGVTEATYEGVTRKKGSFLQFQHGIKLLKEGGIPFRLKEMAIQSNYHEQAEIINYCKAQTKDYYRLGPQLHLRYDGNQERNKEILNERLTAEQINYLENIDSDRMNIISNNCSILVDKRLTSYHGEKLIVCGAGFDNFVVNPEGKLKLCSSLNKAELMYDLRQGSVKDAWDNFIPRIREIKSSRVEYLEKCQSCNLRNLCMWCPAHAFLETGELDCYVPYYCEIAKSRAKNIGYIE